MDDKKILYLYDSEVGSYRISQDKVSQLHIKKEYRKERVLDDVLDVICQEVEQNGYGRVEIDTNEDDLEINGTKIRRIFVKNGFRDVDGVFVKNF